MPAGKEEHSTRDQYSSSIKLCRSLHSGATFYRRVICYHTLRSIKYAAVKQRLDRPSRQLAATETDIKLTLNTFLMYLYG
jgi:hypothetical protein